MVYSSLEFSSRCPKLKKHVFNTYISKVALGVVKNIPTVER